MLEKILSAPPVICKNEVSVQNEQELVTREKKAELLGLKQRGSICRGKREDGRETEEKKKEIRQGSWEMVIAGG
jgi:alpha-D-ribose 1-methylphosphonate 5-triphosphate diphosphatase PhnM